jgi:hypothetical protein
MTKLFYPLIYFDEVEEKYRNLIQQEPLSETQEKNCEGQTL